MSLNHKKAYGKSFFRINGSYSLLRIQMSLIYLFNIRVAFIEKHSLVYSQRKPFKTTLKIKKMFEKL